MLMRCECANALCSVTSGGTCGFNSRYTGTDGAGSVTSDGTCGFKSGFTGTDGAGCSECLTVAR